VLAYLPKPTVSRPRPEIAQIMDETPDGPGGEGGNRSARTIGPQALLTAALLLSAVLVGLTTAVLR
jgi:hypothetical protein